MWHVPPVCNMQHVEESLPCHAMPCMPSAEIPVPCRFRWPYCSLGAQEHQLSGAIMWPVLLLSMLALGPPSVACRRQLLVTVISDEPQTSVPFALPLSQAGSPDLDIDQPPLVSPCLIKWWQVVSNFRARPCAMHQKSIMGRPPPPLPPPPPPRTLPRTHSCRCAQ